MKAVLAEIVMLRIDARGHVDGARVFVRNGCGYSVQHRSAQAQRETKGLGRQREEFHRRQSREDDPRLRPAGVDSGKQPSQAALPVARAAQSGDVVHADRYQHEVGFGGVPGFVEAVQQVLYIPAASMIESPSARR